MEEQKNVVALTDASGNGVDRYQYDLQGKLVSSSKSVPQRLRYTGSRYDSEAGLVLADDAGLRPRAGALPLA